ncbi:MAG: GNAT family N-acetyltransferase [Planctomycetes bacterium]|nr:GNAT family N-acetyltransferase [Planctomycetota bacterium]
MPVVHLGRLAVDRSVQGRRLGEFLLAFALQKAEVVSESIGALAVEVVSVNEAARRFYERYGFQGLVDDRLHLYLPMKTIAKLFGRP